jgi:hypothetical protein
MVILDGHIFGAERAVQPLEAHAPLVVDSDTMRAHSVTLELLQPMAGKIGDIAQLDRGIETVEGLFGLTAKGLEPLDALACGELPGAAVAIVSNYTEM